MRFKTGLLAAILYCFSSSVFAVESGGGDDSILSKSDQRVPLEEIRRFVSVFNAVRSAYVDPVEEKDLMSSAIKGVLLDLDPHSSYFVSGDAINLSDQFSGGYEGIGVEVEELNDSSMRIISLIEGGAAIAAGIKAGDIVVSVDGEPLGRLKEKDPLRGSAGTRVVLGIKRAGVEQPFSIEVERAWIKLHSLSSRILEPGYGYVRIASFQADTGAEFHRHIQKMLRSDSGLYGIVLDLRGNPGGLLTSAVDVADSMLSKGGIVSTRGRLAISDTYFEASQGELLDGVSIVVLVDGGTASASEVLAGALRDNQRALVVGSQTFGKGSVQTVLPLENGDSVKLTTARYYTPSGKSIQSVGISPDVMLDADEATNLAAGDSMNHYSEQELSGHLVGEEEFLSSSQNQRGVLLIGEGPVREALDLLKSLVKDKNPSANVGMKD